MSRPMRPFGRNAPADVGDDLIAAEFVLGVTPADRRQAVRARIDSERGFAQLVDKWAMHFSPLASGYSVVEPPASVKAAIDRRLFPEPAPPADAEPAPRPRPRRRKLWGIAAALAVLAIALPLTIGRIHMRAGTPPDISLVASLAGQGGEVRYIAVFDAPRGEARLSRLSGERVEGHDFQLWVIQDAKAPVSVGLLPAGDTAHVAISPDIEKEFIAGASLAISLEPAGGSPSGQPTGPIIAKGELKSI